MNKYDLEKQYKAAELPIGSTYSHDTAAWAGDRMLWVKVAETSGNQLDRVTCKSAINNTLSHTFKEAYVYLVALPPDYQEDSDPKFQGRWKNI